MGSLKKTEQGFGSFISNVWFHNLWNNLLIHVCRHLDCTISVSLCFYNVNGVCIYPFVLPNCIKGRSVAEQSASIPRYGHKVNRKSED